MLAKKIIINKSVNSKINNIEKSGVQGEGCVSNGVNLISKGSEIEKSDGLQVGLGMKNQSFGGKVLDSCGTKSKF
jgi:hypothetical protein